MNLNVPVDDILAIPVANNSTIASHISLRSNIKNLLRGKKTNACAKFYGNRSNSERVWGYISPSIFIFTKDCCSLTFLTGTWATKSKCLTNPIRYLKSSFLLAHLRSSLMTSVRDMPAPITKFSSLKQSFKVSIDDMSIKTLGSEFRG